MQMIMMNDSKITIVVTVYNKERYIKRCLKSVFDQTDTDFKLIVVDDGSTDKSYSICKKYCKCLDYQVISQVHGGASAARNKGIEIANTDYILFVDGDDYILPETIEVLNNAINHQADLIVFGINYAGEDGSVMFKSMLPERLYNTEAAIHDNLVNLWDSNLMYSSCNKLFSAEIIRRNNLFFKNKDFGEDLTFVCDYTKYCGSIYSINKCLYTYREHSSNSQSKKYRKNLFEIRKDEYYELVRYFYDVGCLNNDSLEFISRRYIERIIGCIENEASLRNLQNLFLRFKRAKAIVEDKTVQECVKSARFRSKKMKILSWFIYNDLPYTLFVLGMAISVVKNGFPKLFIILKMHR